MSGAPAVCGSARGAMCRDDPCCGGHGRGGDADGVRAGDRLVAHGGSAPRDDGLLALWRQDEGARVALLPQPGGRRVPLRGRMRDRGAAAPRQGSPVPPVLPPP